MKKEIEKKYNKKQMVKILKRLILSFASVRTIFGTSHINVPSEFIIDIGDEYLEPVDQQQTMDDKKQRTIYLEE